MTQGASDERQGQFLYSVNWVFLAIVVSFLFGFFGGVVVTRSLTPEDRGLYALFQTTAVLVSTILSLGYHNATVYFVGREGVELRIAISQAPYVLFISTAVTAVLGIFAFALLGHRYEFGLLAVFMLVIAVQAFVAASLFNGVLLVLGRFGLMNVLSMLRPGTFLVLLVLWGVFRLLSLEVTISLWVAAQVVVNGGSIALIYFSHPHTRLIERPQWRLLRRMLVFGVTGQGGNLAQLLSYRLDSYVILAFVGRAGVGYYAIATAVAEALWYLPAAVSTVLIRRLTQGTGSHSPRLTALASRFTLLVCLGGAAVLAVISPVAIPLVFGADYEHAVPVLYGLLPGVLAGVAAKVVANYIFSLGRVRINASVSFIGLGLTLALDLALIPVLGILGAALASSASYLVTTALTLWFFQRLSGHPAIAALVLQRGDVTELIDQARHLPFVAPILRRLA